jgi:hypothetical protein
MDFKLLENTKDLSKTFMERFVMSWDEFQVDRKAFITEMEKKNHPVDFTFYEQSLFWDRMGSKFPCVSMEEALAFLREHSGPVFFMGEKSEDGFWRGKRVVDFIAEADAHDLAAKIDQEWYDSYRLAMQDMYDPNAILPSDLYVFDASMEWCVVFTHETTDWESELDNPMKAAESRVCIICKD